MYCRLKGLCHEICSPLFFMIWTHVQCVLKNFWIIFCFRWDIQIFKKLRHVKSLWCTSLCGDNLRGVHLTAKSISAMWCTPRSQLFQISHKSRTSYLNNLRGVHHTAETISKVCITSRRQSPQGASRRRDNLHVVHPTAETISKVCITPWRQSPQGASRRRDKLHTVE